MSDSTSLIDTISVSQASKEVTANAALNAASPAMLYGMRLSTTTALTWGYYGGRYNSTAIANGTLSLTSSSTNYIVGSKSTGAVSVSTATTNWNDTSNYARLYLVVAGASTITSYEDHRTVTGGAVAGTSPTQCIALACSDETTALTTGTAKITFRMPFGFTLSDVRASLTTAQTSGSIFTVDVNEGGTTVLSTKLTIDNTEKTSTTAATPMVISDTALADDAEITVDIDQIGDGTAKGLKVYLIGVKV
jgi:hypothetical protein